MSKYWLPLDISSHGKPIDELIIITHVFMAILFVGWGIFFVYCLLAFRSRPGHHPSTTLPKATLSKYSEVVVILVEAVLLLAFSIPLWAKSRGVANAPAAADRLEVRVVAEQFGWNFHYPGADGVFGPTSVDLITKENPLGLDRSDPTGKDDIVTLDEMHVPVNKHVLIHLSSKDVIHSFNVPMLRIKQDAVPGQTIPMWFKAVKTTDEVRSHLKRFAAVKVKDWKLLNYHVTMTECTDSNGAMVLPEGHVLTEEDIPMLVEAGVRRIEVAPVVPTQIACAQLCGLGHYSMDAALHVESESDFMAWLTEEAEYLSEDDYGDDYGDEEEEEE